MNHTLRYIYVACTAILLAVVLVSCANRGVGPQGGPKDETPPRILQELPTNGSVLFTGNTITLVCDEYLQMNDVANQVLISPPQRKTPTVKALGKKVVITFDEPLRDSTTYIIDFGKSICDLNEKNPIEGYTYAFSTGSVIDTLQVSGVLINAEDLNPMSNMLIGLHSDLRDSAFLTQTFVSIARTDDKGEFTLRNLSPGRYHIYALDDVSKDFVYQPGEGLAFLDTVFSPIAIDTLVLPSTLSSEKADSITADSLGMLLDSLGMQLDSLAHDSLPFIVADTPSTIAVDSLPALAADSLPALRADTLSAASDSLAPDSLPTYVKQTRYEPSGIVLRYFSENKRRLYFNRCLREERHCFKLLFAAPQDSMPRFDSLPPSLVQTSLHFDTITVWLQDSASILQDTIEFAMTYQQTDSIYNIRWATDTIRALYRAPRLTPQAQEALERAKKKAPAPSLELKSNASNTFEVYDKLTLTFPLPLAQWQQDSLHLYKLSDADTVPAEFQLLKADSCGSRFIVACDWEPAMEYVLQVDSAAFTSMYGVSNLQQTIKLKLKSLEDYSTLILKVEPFNPNMMIQVLTDKEQVVRTLRADTAGARFEYMPAESFYVRLFDDQNGDSVWTTGDWLLHRQPEPVYYFDKKLTLRANWEFEETVLYLEKSILEQKPQEIKKDGNDKKKK